MEKRLFKTFLTILFGFLIATILYHLFTILFIKENEFGYNYRFPEVKGLWNYLYEGYHYEATNLNILITFSLGLVLSYQLVQFIFKK